MDQRDERDHRQDYFRRQRSGKIWAGLFLLLVGSVLLLDQMNFPLPDWLFKWHVLLIALGLFIGLRHRFRGGLWFILMVVGGVLLFQDYNPDSHLQRFIWPSFIILAGLMIMLKPHRYRPHRHQWGHEWRDEWEKKQAEWRQQHGQNRWQGPTVFTSQKENYSSEDYIDTTAIFGGVHKKIMSKNFKGGDIVTVMGGTEIDLTQADFTGKIRLDITQVMGGTKIIVPAHWEVRSDMTTTLFAGFEDKRTQTAVTNPDKVLIIDGTSILGGIELKNF